MPAKLDRCVKKLMADGKTEEQAYAICNASIADGVFVGHFNDAMTFNADTKTAVSVRDGYLEYMGAEIGMEPADKTFKVYRSPATIANAAAAMKGIPLTDEHVDLEEPPRNPVGNIIDGTMIDMRAPETNTTLAVSNRVKLGDAIMGAIQTGKRELSLGYKAELVPYEGDEGYDLEQRNIRPHHLAVVSAGRCGPSCSFIDRKPDEEDPMSKQKQAEPAKLHAAFKDADGEMSLEKIIEIATSLPEALKKMPLPKIQELMPALQEAMTAAEEAGVEPSERTTEAVEETETVEDASDEMEDKDKEEMAVTDTAEFKDALAKGKDAAIKDHMAIVEKARQFVDENYTFQGKSGEQIMRDALAKEGHDAKSFADAELSVAFKLLKPGKAANTLRTFGDQAPTTHRFSDIADKDI